MKKEIIKSFNLEAYKNGAKIKTRDGHEARIICTDAKNPHFPIVALIKLVDCSEITQSYTSKGKTQLTKGTISDNDLVIVEEVEVPEFWSDREHKEANGYYIDFLSSIIPKSKGRYYRDTYNLFATKKQAKSALAMARISQIMANDIEHFGGAITDKEWLETSVKSTIYRAGSRIELESTVYEYHFLAFHTAAQRDLFLKKYRDLVKDYLMID